MKKRLLSGLLSFALIVALLPTAFAAQSDVQTEMFQALAALEIMVGDENGDLSLSAPVTRAEFTKMAVAASAYADHVGEASVSPYPDVPKNHWAAGYVQTAVSAGLITGYLDGTFRPQNTIALAEGVTIVLRLLGYQNSDFSGAYPSGQMALYRSMDLDKGVSVSGNTEPLTRADCANLFYNLLTATSKTTGKPHINTLGHALTASGEVDLVSLVNAAMEGPVVAQSGWESEMDVNPAACTVYRAGKLSSYSAVQNGDVIYWSDSMRTLWVYTDRASGTIAALSPSAAAPASVTVAGKTYAIETASAAYALSDLSGTQVGDTVTLLLGRTGVAAVLSGAQAQESTLCGMVTAVAPGAYSDGNGNSYVADTVTLIATDGNTYSYRSDNTGLEAGDLARVTITGDKVTVKRLGEKSLSGRVNAEGTKLGSRTFANGVQILEVCNQSALRIYPERLAGISLGEEQVLYYELNANDEISRLILSDVTGDLHTYGVLTDVTEISVGFNLSGVYVYDAAGKPGMIQGSVLYGVSRGPMVIKWDGDQVASLKNLTRVKLDAASGTVAQSGNQSYAVSEQVVVYELRDGDYYLSSLALVNGGDHTLTGWYDKAAASGGRIRVIVAEEKD